MGLEAMASAFCPGDAHLSIAGFRWSDDVEAPASLQQLHFPQLTVSPWQVPAQKL